MVSHWALEQWLVRCQWNRKLEPRGTQPHSQDFQEHTLLWKACTLLVRGEARAVAHGKHFLEPAAIDTAGWKHRHFSEMVCPSAWCSHWHHFPRAGVGWCSCQPAWSSALTEGWRALRGGRATSQHRVLAERQKGPALTGAHRAGHQLQTHGSSSKRGKVTGLHKTPGKSLQSDLSKMKNM